LRSDAVKVGVQRAPHRALLKALGLADKDLTKPFIGVVNSFTNIVPGHAHLNQVADAVKAGVISAEILPSRGTALLPRIVRAYITRFRLAV